MSVLIQLQFKDPNHRILMSDGYPERKSKQVDEKSLLHKVVTELRKEIREHWPDCPTYDDRPIHVELSKKILSDSDMAQLALSLHGKTLDLRNPQLWGWCGNVFVIVIDAKQKLHCTILCFRTSRTPALDSLQSFVQKVVKIVA
jgi:hypothetical protein